MGEYIYIYKQKKLYIKHSFIKTNLGKQNSGVFYKNNNIYSNLNFKNKKCNKN